MTTPVATQVLDIRSNHDKVRALFERFGQATGEEKKAVAREMLSVLPIRQR